MTAAWKTSGIHSMYDNLLTKQLDYEWRKNFNLQNWIVWIECPNTRERGNLIVKFMLNLPQKCFASLRSLRQNKNSKSETLRNINLRTTITLPNFALYDLKRLQAHLGRTRDLELHHNTKMVAINKYIKNDIIIDG